jgi:hypothetical protein
MTMESGVTDSGADGSDSSMTMTGTDGSSNVDSGILPRCVSVMMQGPASFVGDCDLAMGKGILQPHHSAIGYDVCSCECIDGSNIDHGRGQCAPMQPDPCSAQCGF